MPTISTKVALAMMKRALLFVAASFFLAPSAYAQDPCDFNGDGTVDQFEAESCGGPPPGGEPTFEEWQISPEATDTNDNGVIDLDDYYVHFPAAWLSSPGAIDYTGDGFIDFDDFFVFVDQSGGAPPPWGDPCDFDGDGVVDPTEADGCSPPSPGHDLPRPEEWLAGPEATDTNGNGVIDLDDYYLHFPAAWLSSPGAIDYTGDGFIDFDDFFVFADQIGGAPPPWGDPCDFDGDGVVDPTEADGCSPPSPGPDFPRPEDWLAGPEAVDLNDDGEIDNVDYVLFFGLSGPDFSSPEDWLASSPESPEDWLAGPDAVDLNDDGEIDTLDFILFFGLSPVPDFSSPESPPEGGDRPPGGDPCDFNGDGTVDQFEADSCGDPPPGDEPTFEAWQISPEATDTNDNGVIDLDDYYLHFPAAWLSSPGAIDYTGDGFIDFDDFFVFVDQNGGAPPFWGDPCDLDGDGVVDPTEADGCRPPSPEDWLSGPDADDLNDDGEIDILDYELFFGLSPGPDFSSPEDWLAGPEAADLNDDGEIDILDYVLFFDGPDFLSPPSPEDWLSGPDADDLNDDGEIDILDYELFFGLSPGPDFPPPEEWPPGGEPTFEAWQISPEATDTNDNGVIDLDDYYVHFPAAWLSSPGAIDYNGDGSIDF
ncbi:MAG: hypothetical protein VX948_02115, partial [Candidatus Latescibacterota bacterium]|nr:hypothetical protein [Candidatus Latescibacterota bacterium]